MKQLFRSNDCSRSSRFALVLLSVWPLALRFLFLLFLLHPLLLHSSFLHSALSCSPPPAGVSLISRLSIYFCVLLGAGFVLRCLRLTRMERAILVRTIMERENESSKNANLQRKSCRIRESTKNQYGFSGEILRKYKIKSGFHQIMKYRFTQLGAKIVIAKLESPRIINVINVALPRVSRNATQRLIENSPYHFHRSFGLTDRDKSHRIAKGDSLV